MDGALNDVVRDALESQSAYPLWIVQSFVVVTKNFRVVSEVLIYTSVV
jgi:hypothetical protein